MNCFQCKKAIECQSDKLQCCECAGVYHLKCLPHIKKPDFEYIVSTGTFWKCLICDKKKSSRGDKTPLTPTIQKEIPRFSSDTDSDPNTTRANKKAICKKCLKGFSHNAHRASCTKCESLFHIKCVSEFSSRDDFFKVKNTWLCIFCSNEISALAAAKPHTEMVVPGASLSDVLIEMKSFRREVFKSNQDFKDSMEKYAEWIVENGKKIDEAIKQIGDVVKQVEEVRQENINLNKKVKQLIEKVNVLEQSQKDSVVEIQGVPLVNNENILEIIRKISEIIGFDFNECKIDNCYRMKAFAGGRPGSIVVKFVRKLDTQLFVAKRRQKRNLNSRDIGYMSGDASVIYVNYSLTQENRKLLGAARLAKRDKQYAYLWVNNGRIYMRKNQGDPHIVINNIDDLDKLV